jgi:hypothetical protein
MQSLAVIFFGICAGFAIEKAFKAYRWRKIRRFWIFSLIAVSFLAATAVSAWSFFANPIMHGRVNSGFGPDWICTNPGNGDPVCIKQTPTTSTASTHSN